MAVRLLKVSSVATALIASSGFYLYSQKVDFNDLSIVRFGRAVATTAVISYDYLTALREVPYGTEEYWSLKSQVHRRSAERLRDLCCVNRGTFIKVGQHLGALDYLLPEEYTSTLKILHSRAPASTMQEIQQVIREDLGKEFYFSSLQLDELFVSFEEKPQGAASLAQVHKAVLANGTTVAVKVQHPKVQAQSSKDIMVMEFLLQVVHWLFPDFAFMWLVEEAKRNMPLELDFLNEGRNAEKVSHMLKHFDFLKVPKIHWNLSTKRVLTMDFVEGGQVNDREYMTHHGIDVNEISRNLGRMYSEMIFVNGFVHCDPHPGNVLVRKCPKSNKTEIVLLDHGLYQLLKQEFRLDYCRLWQSLIKGDMKGIERYSRRLGAGDLYPLFTCVLTARSWTAVSTGISHTPVTSSEGAGGNWATVGRRSRGGRRVRRQREKRKGKGRELADVMERRKVDILCVQETRWKGSKARSIGAGFKLFYYGVDSKRNGVGVVLKEEFVRNVLEVGCELEEKEKFWSELDEVMESIPTGDEEVMGKFGVKERNLEGQMVVDFAKRMDMGVVNTYFQKREEHRVTYKSGGRRTQKKRKKLRQALGGQVVLPDDWETTAEVIRETGRKDSIQRKRLAKKKWDMDRTEENRQEYKELQRRVKREVSKAKQKAYDELYTRLDTREGEKDLYRVLTSEESVQRRWKEYFEELMNEENEREKRVEEVNSVEQKVDKIRKDEVRKALKRMKSGKAVGPDDIPVEVWKCLGEAAVEFLANLFNRVLESEKMPEEWRRSVLVPIFKNKGDVQSCSNYRGIKLMSHTMKLWERVVEARLRKVVEICEQQYGFMPRKSTTDAIFALRILMEKYRDGQRELHCVFVDLEKAYDRVPREELWYCMRKSGVAEKYVRVVQDMYERSRTVVRCAVGQTEEFNVEVGLHQGSALSPFLFAIVMDQLSEEVRQESPWTMMFADDIVICSESREQVEENLERWRFALERRGMKVSRSKTEYMCVNEREGSGTVRLQGEEVKKVQEFKYLGSTVQSNGECGKEDFDNALLGQGLRDVEIRTNAALYLPQISELLNRVPRQMLLLLKTNDLLRGIETVLQTRASSSSFISMSRCCTRALASYKRSKTDSRMKRLQISVSESLALCQISLFEVVLWIRSSLLVKWMCYALGCLPFAH
ncbi:hypothetical protein QTP86_021637 [Hemibagrus guttatus]|nr:hypothetical protein QTP86_021637 [Hemibagrus guttatus]